MAAALLAASLGACGFVEVQNRQSRPPAEGAGRPGADAVQRSGTVQVVGGQRTTTVKSGDTLYGVAAALNVTPNQLIALNDLEPPYHLVVGQRLTLPPEQTLHRVQAGETLSKIARDYKVDLYTLASNNHLGPPYLLRAGETIGVPRLGGAVAAAPPSSSATARVDRNVPARSRDGVQVESLPPPERPAASASTPEQQPERQPAPAAAPAPKPEPQRSLPTARQVDEAPKTARVDPAPPPEPAAPAGAPRAATPGQDGGFLAPVDGPVLANFGSQADGRRNDGVNIAAPKGTAVRAAQDGEVVYAGDALQGYGNLILLRHGDGWVTAYAHLDRILAKRGEKVTRGQTIGAVGATGGVSKPQLHFEMRKDNKAVNPIGRLAAR